MKILFHYIGYILLNNLLTKKTFNTHKKAAQLALEFNIFIQHIPDGSNYWFYLDSLRIANKNGCKFEKSRNTISTHLTLKGVTPDCCLYFNDNQMDTLNKILSLLELEEFKYLKINNYPNDPYLIV